MKPHHIKVRLKQLEVLAASSHCTRRGVAALAIDPETNMILSDGYNGTPAGTANTCGSDGTCERQTKCVPSGTMVELGCTHAELSMIFRACQFGRSLKGSHVFINTPPCLNCAKALKRVEVAKVFYIDDGSWSGETGIGYLEGNFVEVEEASRYLKK